MRACMRVNDSVDESVGTRREERMREWRVIKVFQRRKDVQDARMAE